MVAKNLEIHLGLLRKCKYLNISAAVITLI